MGDWPIKFHVLPEKIISIVSMVMFTIFRELLHSEAISELDHVETVRGSVKGFSAGYDDIQISIHYDFFDVLGLISNSICSNRSTLEIFPHKLAIRKVICLRENVDIKLIFFNYQLISIFPAFNYSNRKSCEFVNEKYLEFHNLINNSQFGFMPKYSTELACHTIIKDNK